MVTRVRSQRRQIPYLEKNVIKRCIWVEVRKVWGKNLERSREFASVASVASVASDFTPPERTLLVTLLANGHTSLTH